jgi:hypothetical protein
MTDRLQEYKNRLEAYEKAEMTILDGAQSYQLNGRNLTRANLSEVRQMIEYLINRIEIEESRVNGKGRNKVVGIIPRDI